MNQFIRGDCPARHLTCHRLSRSFMVPVVLLVMVLATACAPALPEKKQYDLVWPLPPDEPRIKYVDVIRGTFDLGRKTGIAESIFGETEDIGFKKPYGVAVDAEGKIYVTDIGKVFVFDMKNKEYSLIGADPGTGRLASPIGIAMANDGRVFVSDTSMDKIFVYSKEKFVTAIGKAGDFGNPTGLAVDDRRRLLYIVDTKSHVVHVHSLDDYSRIRSIGKRGEADGEFNFPTNIAIDASGKVYVSDGANFRFQIFDAEGKHIRSVGKLGDTPGSFARPKGIAVDSEGNIYVVDTAFQNFQIFDQEGNLNFFIGGAGLEPGKFSLPAGISIDREDKIYVIDQTPGLLQIFQYLGDPEKRKKQ